MSTAEFVPYQASLEAYERKSEGLFAAIKAGEESAAWRFKWLHPSFRGRHVSDVNAAALELADARLVVAQEHSFESWAELAAFTDDVRREGPTARFEAAVEAVIAGNLEALRSMLEADPVLIRARSVRRHHATLLHYVAANGVENGRQKTPANAVAVARTLLDAGAEVDALADMYDEKCTTMSMLVSSAHPANAGLQATLAETLLDYGAALDGVGTKWQSPVMTALQFGYLGTAEALARRGGAATSLPAAAGLGLTEIAARLLPDADAHTRHAALTLAAQHGQTDVVRLLLDAGEDPNRFNPEGFHAGSTPLHQAAYGGHAEVVRLLTERGARLDIRDEDFDGTPLGWAIHAGQTAVAEYLRAQATRTDS
jgi:ankyrin repeat protein